MATNIATTKKQSARLLQCGVSAESADMYYQVPITLSQKQRGEDILLLKRPGKTLYNIDTPAWSLSALLNLMPRTVTHKGRTNIFGLYREEEKDGGGWNYSCPGIAYFIEDTPFEAVIKMIEWLTANNYKLNQL